MKLEKQLKHDAAFQLSQLVEQLKIYADQTAKGAGLTGDTLCRLVVGRRVESIRKSAIAKMAFKKGEALYRQYTAQNKEASK